MASPDQKAQLPKLTGGDGSAALREYQKAEIENINAVTAAPIIAGNAAGLGKTNVAPTPEPPAPRPPAPDFEAYWVDAYGKVWRKLPVPTVILSITSACSQKELDTIVNTLLKGE